MGASSIHKGTYPNEGKLDADGFVSVTGHLKEQYKLENGKYVSPTPIEEAIGMSIFISQVVVCGMRCQLSSQIGWLLEPNLEI